MPKTSQTIEERFWAKVEKGKGRDACWIWTANTNKDGYGFFKVGKTNVLVHRLSAFMNGIIPDLKSPDYVLHKCDTPACIRPSHLYAGDQYRNMKDAIDRKRFNDRSGPNNIKAKLTWPDVRRIRRMKDQSPSAKNRMAVKCGVSICTINDILFNRSWRE